MNRRLILTVLGIPLGVFLWFALVGPHSTMDRQVPNWLINVFTVINAFIALAYALLAVFFIKRIKLPSRSERNPLSILACVGAAFFFLGCAHTHLDLMWWSGTDALIDHWYSWWNVLSHSLQALGGLTFWVLATFYLKLNIFDKQHYEKTVRNK